MRAITASVGWFLVVASASCPAQEDGSPPFYDIGRVHREVSTRDSRAQRWFDRGLALAFGFNHEESIRCFERAAAADPDLAMAWWGKAYALGPNYNNVAMTEDASRAAHEALAEATARIGGATLVEAGLIWALQGRYAWPAPEDHTALDRAYAGRMKTLRDAHPDDPDVTALLAESLMILRPWKLWSPTGEPAPETPEIRAVLEAGLGRWPDHPALCHLYIHAMEASPDPELAEPAADRLLAAVPGSGHLRHMPSHIYVWTGRYADVVASNRLGIEMDRAYVEVAGRENFYTLYRAHNYHFLAYGAMFTGQKAVALEAARELVREIPDALLEQMADFVEVFLATPFHVMVRFGMWDAILAEPEPAGRLLATRAVWRYARGVALAARGRLDEAGAELEAFRAARRAVPSSRLLFQNPVERILAVADVVLEGELEYRRGHHERAFELLRRAVQLDLALSYDEPWGWMEPASHPLGALLLEQGRLDEAMAVYRADLERYPENGWSLHGLAECLRRAGRAEESAAVEARFRTAWASADTAIPGSCFCRTE